MAKFAVILVLLATVRTASQGPAWDDFQASHPETPREGVEFVGLGWCQDIGGDTLSNVQWRALDELTADGYDAQLQLCARAAAEASSASQAVVGLMFGSNHFCTIYVDDHAEARSSADWVQAARGVLGAERRVYSDNGGAGEVANSSGDSQRMCYRVVRPTTTTASTTSTTTTPLSTTTVPSSTASTTTATTTSATATTTSSTSSSTASTTTATTTSATATTTSSTTTATTTTTTVSSNHLIHVLLLEGQATQEVWEATAAADDEGSEEAPRAGGSPFDGRDEDFSSFDDGGAAAGVVSSVLVWLWAALATPGFA